MTHMLPRLFTTSETPQTRDLGLKTYGSRVSADWRHMVWLPDTNMRSRVSASCWRREVVGPREFCRLAQVTAGARPRKTVTGRMAKIDRFLLFAASLHCKRKTASGQRPKTAEIDQPRKPNGCAPSTSTSSTLLHGHYSRTVSPNQTISGREGAVKARSNPPCTLPAQPKASVFISNGCQ